MNGIVIDNFAGGGGASVAIEQAIGRPIDYAVNHDPQAIAMHRANHPHTYHYCEDVWDVDPRDVAAGRNVALAWFSPDCKHFSRAKGGRPVDKSIRGLAWVATRYAATVQPDVIFLENVQEFREWGPLVNEIPNPDLKGKTYQNWLKEFRRLGYEVDTRNLVACDYGAPTSRKRLFLVARRDGLPIVWPEPTHGNGGKPYRTAAECIDWSIPCPSIFSRKKPLAENTLRRIARGLERFVIDATDPFIIVSSHAGQGDASGGKTGLVTSHLIKFRGTNIGNDIRDTVPTITAGGLHLGEVRAFLIKYYGTAVGQSLMEPAHTVTEKARLGLVTVEGQDYMIADIGMRMLSPRELFLAQGFPEDYIIDPIHNGRPLTKTTQVKMCGNSVSPHPAEALVRANALET